MEIEAVKLLAEMAAGFAFIFALGGYVAYRMFGGGDDE